MLLRKRNTDNMSLRKTNTDTKILRQTNTSKIFLRKKNTATMMMVRGRRLHSDEIGERKHRLKLKSMM